MQRALSTYCLAGQRLNTVWLDRIGDAGIPLIEIYCSRRHLDYHDHAQVNDIAAWFRNAELKVHSLHSPLYSDESGGRGGPQTRVNITETVKAKRIAIVDEVKRALDLIEAFPFRYFVQHIGIEGEEYDERKLDSAFTSLEEIRIFAKQRGVEVLLENLASGLASTERLLHFNDITHLNLNFCYDSGHANRYEDAVQAAQMMRGRLRSTHLHDNDGKNDQHLHPLQGNIPWRRVMTELRAQHQKQDFPMLLEIKELDPGPNPFDQVRKTFDALEQLPSLHAEEMEG
ncbi:hypothetical protein F183_A45460 [Bryobacterales bacterium F-183]|nr:hypothetical protein F183_A45460 [Bryobacterales bacterium F-183]